MFIRAEAREHFRSRVAKLCFATSTMTRWVIWRQPVLWVSEDLDRDAAVEPRVARLIDLAHPARAQCGQDLVRTQASSEDEQHGCGGDASRLEFDELVRVMRQIESLFVRDRSDSPLLHRQGAEQNLDRGAILVSADVVAHQRVG